MSESKKRKRRGERPDGRIQVTYTDGLRPDGKPNRLSFYGSTRKEAESKRQAYIDQQKSGLITTSGDISMSEWIDAWETTYKKNASSIDKSMIGFIKADLGAYNLRDVQEAHLVRAMQRYEGKSHGTAEKYRMLIRQIFRKAKKNRLIVIDPSDDLPLPETTPSGSHRALEQWEIDILLGSWRDSDQGRWAMVMMLGGLRRGEMAALDWGDVDLDGRTISIHRNAVYQAGGGTRINDHTKTDAGMRTVPICQALYDCLNSVPVDDRSGFVCRAHGKQITITSVSLMWTKFCRRLSEEHNVRFSCRTHDLRHTYATILFEAGIDVKSAQYYLGHKNLQMTLGLYTHLSESHTRITSQALRTHMDAWIDGKNNR